LCYECCSWTKYRLRKLAETLIFQKQLSAWGLFKKTSINVKQVRHLVWTWRRDWTSPAQYPVQAADSAASRKTVQWLSFSAATYQCKSKI
jgi:hypothetical protein